MLAPLGHTIWLSLHQWDGLTPATWVGLDNYREILQSGPLRSAFEHSFVLIVFYAVIPVTLALVLVGALSRGADPRPGGLPDGALPAAGDPDGRRRRDLADDLRAATGR